MQARPTIVLHKLYLSSLSLSVPFRISKLVTRLIASRGDFEVKNLGVRLGGKVSGLRDPAVPTEFSAQAVAPKEKPRAPPGAELIDELSRSRCSVDTGRVVVCRCFGYHPRAGPPASRSISPLASNDWWFCNMRRVFEALPLLLLLRTVLSRVLPVPKMHMERGYCSELRRSLPLTYSPN